MTTPPHRPSADLAPAARLPTSVGPPRGRVRPSHFAVGAFLVVVAAVLFVGATRFPLDKGYTIVGPHVFPMLVAAFTGFVGVVLCIQAATGGFRNLAPQSAHPADLARAGRAGAAWVSAGLLADALLITHIGFVLAAAVLFVCAARGFGSRRPFRDLAVGIATTLPVYWLFTAGLGVSLPRLINAWI
ncbi:MAG TPA: tripartite tricarboxylate transporter TctB family protein [Burkholderiaceae bacterium]|nr:tripartite tricarboxylate transporter TctB family protein [Burkholderiaceae bacterium]